MVLTKVGITDVATLINQKYDYVAIGTGTAPTADSTTLNAEAMRVQSVNTVIDHGSVGYNNCSQQTATFNITGTLALTNSAVFDIDTAGIMLCGQSFATINVVSGDTFIAVWKEVVS